MVLHYLLYIYNIIYAINSLLYEDRLYIPDTTYLNKNWSMKYKQSIIMNFTKWENYMNCEI